MTEGRDRKLYVSIPRIATLLLLLLRALMEWKDESSEAGGTKPKNAPLLGPIRLEGLCSVSAAPSTFNKVEELISFRPMPGLSRGDGNALSAVDISP